LNGRAALRKIRRSKDGFDLAQPPVPMNKGELPCRVGIASFGRTKAGRPQALVCAQLTGFDLINPKHLLNGCKLKAGSI